MQPKALQIVSDPSDMTEGLFGQVVLFVFEILPYLFERGIFPEWKISAAHYGFGSGNLVIPGALDVAYELPKIETVSITLADARKRFCRILGNDWTGLSQLWHQYFRIPDRFQEFAVNAVSMATTLGVHYRGTDKQLASWDTNPVSHGDYLAIIKDALARNPRLNRIYLATDDNAFYGFLQANVSTEIIYYGPVPYHKAPINHESIPMKTNRAMIDCLMLSRCQLVLQTSSALSGFSKILNPTLKIFRVAASKQFASIPYFPVAYIPIYTSQNPQIGELLARLLHDDWLQRPGSERFKQPFTYMDGYYSG